MKVNEIPFSLYHILRLSAIPANRIKNPSGEVLPVVVSLTTIPSRLNIVNLVIRNILSQEKIPHKIVLSVSESLKDSIPRGLRKLESSFFEIHFSPLDAPHLKLVNALELYPNDLIVTCDDDVLYPGDWLSALYDSHLERPGYIIAHRIRHIRYDSKREPLPYRKWPFISRNENDSASLLPVGNQGVLYPPGSLSELVTNSKLFLELTPRTDDLWFKAMSEIKGTRCRLPDRQIGRSYPIIGSQGVSLKKVNVDRDANRHAWLRLVRHFNLRNREI